MFKAGLAGMFISDATDDSRRQIAMRIVPDQPRLEADAFQSGFPQSIDLPWLQFLVNDDIAAVGPRAEPLVDLNRIDFQDLAKIDGDGGGIARHLRIDKESVADRAGSDDAVLLIEQIAATS